MSYRSRLRKQPRIVYKHESDGEEENSLRDPEINPDRSQVHLSLPPLALDPVTLYPITPYRTTQDFTRQDPPLRYPRAENPRSENPRSEDPHFNYRSEDQRLNYSQFEDPRFDSRSEDQRLNYPHIGDHYFDYPRSEDHRLDCPRSEDHYLDHPRSEDRYLEHPHSEDYRQEFPSQEPYQDPYQAYSRRDYPQFEYPDPQDTRLPYPYFQDPGYRSTSSNNDRDQVFPPDSAPEPLLSSTIALPPLALDPVTLYPMAPHTIPEGVLAQQYPRLRYPNRRRVDSEDDRDQDQSPPSEAVTQAAEDLPAGWEERTVTMSYYVNESTGASTWERPEMSTTITENQGPLPSEARENANHAGANRHRFVASKQHLYAIVRAGLILQGDQLQYKGAEHVQCTITVRGITSRYFLNVTVAFLPDATVASSSSAPPQPPIHADGVRNPTELENILLRNRGGDTSRLPRGLRRRAWGSFLVVRGGREVGTFAELRRILGEPRERREREES